MHDGHRDQECRCDGALQMKLVNHFCSRVNQMEGWSGCTGLERPGRGWYGKAIMSFVGRCMTSPRDRTVPSSYLIVISITILAPRLSPVYTLTSTFQPSNASR